MDLKTYERFLESEPWKTSFVYGRIENRLNLIG